MSPTSRPRTARLEHAVLLGAQCLGFVLFASSWQRLDGFPLDDAWIHQVVARTFAATGTLGYLPGVFGSGATSYLWAALLAPNYAVVHIDPVAYTLVVNLALFALCTHGLLALLRLDGLAPSVRVTVASCASVGGNFVWFAFSGMEALLLASLSVTAIVLLTRPNPTRRSMLGAGACLALLVLSRPEAALLGPLLACWLALERRPRRELALLLAPWVAGLVIYYGANLVLTGHAVPPTLEGRRWMWLDASAGHSRLFVWGAFVTEWLTRLRTFSFGSTSRVVTAVTVALAIAGILEAVRRKYRRLLLLGLWSAAHLGTYVLILPMLGHGGRYQPLTPLVFVLFTTLGAVAVAQAAVRRLVRDASAPFPCALAIVVPLVPLAWLLTRGLLLWHDGHARAIEHIRNTEQALAIEFDQLPGEARIASFDIGASGFFSAHDVLDLGALTRPATVAYLRAGTIADYMRLNRVTHVAIPLGYNDTFPDLFNFGYRLHLFENPTVTLRPIRFLESPVEVWEPGIHSTMHSAPRQGIFEVVYPGATSAAPTVEGDAALRRVHDEEKLLSTESTRQLEYCLAAMAQAGLPTVVSLSSVPPGVPSLPPGMALHLSAGSWGVRVDRAQALSRDDAARQDELIEGWLRSYLSLGDLAGAVRAALHALTLVQRFREPGFQPMLPPLPYAAPPPALPTEAVFPIFAALVALVTGGAWLVNRTLTQPSRS